jgi:glycosyltransferase involved in cell wall biosynthesis
VPRRVLFLAWAPFFSGAERALLLTVQHLDPGRYVPHVIVGTEGDTAGALREARVACEVLPLRHLDLRHAVAWAGSVGRVLAVARRVGASLIHANDVPSFQPGGYAARALRIPALTHVRFPDRLSGFSWFLRSGFTRALFVSEALQADAMEDCGTLFDGKSEVLHDGVVLPPPVAEAERLSLRHELGLPELAPVVALTGQVSEVKGIWEFVEAARLLVTRGTDATFVVLGDDLKGHGALRLSMEERVAALGLASHFRFLGFRNDAPRLIPAFDIVAVPSHIEPLGNATLEAMAVGRPVVGSRVGGIPEMVVDGQTGRLVPPRDPSALAEAVGSLVESPEICRHYGLAARLRAESHFSLPLHGQRLQRIYDAVLGARAGDTGAGTRLCRHSGT